jgi:hypothetical protein
MVNFEQPPQQPGWVPPPGPVPSGPVPPGPVASRKLPRLLIPGLVAVAVLAVACAGAAGYGVVRATNNIRSASDSPSARALPGIPGASAAASRDPEGDEEVGPRASSYPVRTAKDLARVCEQWYYPQSPKHRAKESNPISVQVRDDGFDLWSAKDLWSMKYEVRGATEKAWKPTSLTKVRLVACVELVDDGKKVRTCEFDEPKEKVPMREGVYRLTLYEVATGRKLTEKRMTGENDECPFLVMLDASRTIHSEINERQLFETFRRYVEK